MNEININNLSSLNGFSWALDQLKIGNRVARSSWSSYLYLVPGKNTSSEFLKDEIYLPYICIVSNDKIVPWVPSQEDMLSEDWRLNVNSDGECFKYINGKTSPKDIIERSLIKHHNNVTEEFIEDIFEILFTKFKDIYIGEYPCPSLHGEDVETRFIKLIAGENVATQLANMYSTEHPLVITDVSFVGGNIKIRCSGNKIK